MDQSLLKEEYQRNRERYLAEWKEYLRFKSVSGVPEYESQCRACAGWLLSHLGDLGFVGQIVETSGLPLVLAEYQVNSDAPTVLFYGHYDVQPPEPLEEWKTDPFEPTLVGDRVYARGAMDNKGQSFYALKALETLIEHNALKYNVKILLEGEEECGSSGISKLLVDGFDADISADYLLVCDTLSLPDGRTVVVMGLKGLVAFTLEMYGANTDLHSGMHGACVPNPARGIAELVASFHRVDGSVAVEGFYDGVKEPSPEQVALAEGAYFGAAEYEKIVGVAPLSGETRYSPAVRFGFRPTLDINGIGSGYTGTGNKTVLPRKAIAKVTCRLVAGQDPASVVNSIREHVARFTPVGLRSEVVEVDLGGKALCLDPSLPNIQRVSELLRSVEAQNPAYQWVGASVPVVPLLAEVAGAEPILVGYGLEEDLMHAPNESFSLAQFERGFMFCGMFFSTT